MQIILHLLSFIHVQKNTILFLLKFICSYVPIKQSLFDDSHSPKYNKFTTNKLPTLIVRKQDWDFKDLIKYCNQRYNYVLKPVKKRSVSNIDNDCTCPCCGAPEPYLYRNNCSKGQLVWQGFLRISGLLPMVTVLIL